MGGVAQSRHTAVLLQPVVEKLAPYPGAVFCDLTLGAAGHFIEIARRLTPGGVAVGCDRDAEALERARMRIEAVSFDRVEIHLVKSDFGGLRGMMMRLGLEYADRILMDLGLSSDQLLDAGRGFSFQRDGSLDMRQDLDQDLTAADVVNGYAVDELERILREYGGERYAGLIAAAIDRRRRQAPLEGTLELAELIAAAIPSRRGRTHPATRAFQALRIEVGDELGQLRRCLPQAAELLSPGGRLAVITFHSLEDVVVKESLRPFGRRGGRTDWQLVRRGRVVRPDAAEVRGNPRSRSAKLRVYEKVRVEKAKTG